MPLACHAPWLVWYLLLRECLSGWWFGTFFIFHNIWDNPSHWLSYFSRWLKPPTSYIPPPWWWSSFEHKPGAGQSPCIWLYPKTEETLKLYSTILQEENEVSDSGVFGFSNNFQTHPQKWISYGCFYILWSPIIFHYISLYLPLKNPIHIPSSPIDIKS